MTGANAEAEATMVAIMAAVFMMRIVSIFGVCLRYRYRRRLSVAMLAKAKAKSGASEADGDDLDLGARFLTSSYVVRDELR